MIGLFYRVLNNKMEVIKGDYFRQLSQIVKPMRQLV
jgi:hypothetical protein